MQSLLALFALFLATTSCRQTSRQPVVIRDTTPPKVLSADTVLPPEPYEDISYVNRETLASAPGTKSVIFNSTGSKLYAMNLEGMSVYEFDQASRKINREFRFTPTRGTGWDYTHNRPIPSYQEKPVEACFSHGDDILWVSLHNAGGIVPIWVNDFSKNTARPTGEQATKPVTVLYPGSAKRDSFYVPLIATGKTPKVIAKTHDSRYLLVSNWHSHTISVLQLDPAVYPFGTVVSTIPTSAIPRGIAVDDKAGKSFVAIMGGASLAVIDNQIWKSDSVINVLSNPRHIVMDTTGHLFVTYNGLGMIACLDAATGKQLFTASTHSQPRTIGLSKNHRFIFVTCYSGDMVDVYKINPDSFTKIASLPCGGHPVGVDIFENNHTLEAWVCSYSSGSINVYSFSKK